MQREKLRPNYLVRVFKYWIRPDFIPDEVWQDAREQQRVWNQLVALRDICLAETKDKDMDKTVKKERWARYNTDIRAAVKASRLAWATQENLLMRFESMAKKALKEGTAVGVQHRLNKVMFMQRFTGGGLPVHRIFRDLKYSFAVEDIPSKAYAATPKAKNPWANRSQRNTTGVFKIGQAAVRFTVNMHRAIPPGAFVKAVMLCGNKMENRGVNYRPKHYGELKEPWEWSLNLVLEVPPPPKIQGDTRPVCGIDFGWRIMAEGEYIRVAYVVDSEGNSFEFRLPLTKLTSRVKKMARRKIKSGGWKEYHGYVGLIDVDQRIGTAVQDLKTELLNLLPKNETVFLVKKRQSGILRMKQDYLDNQIYPEAIQAITNWQMEDAKLWQEKNMLYARLNARRRWIYRNLASWLTKRYQLIAWEKDLGIKQMAEQKGKAPALEAADRYRQWAAPSELRTAILHAAPKNNSQINPRETAMSTLTCWECGSVIANNNGSLFLECPNGHKHDQDANTATLFVCEAGNYSPQQFRDILARRSRQVITLPQIFGGITQL